MSRTANGDDLTQDDQIKRVKYCIKNNAPLRETEGLRPSRRVRGMWDTGQEVRAYKNVNIFIQKSASGDKAIYQDILRGVNNAQSEKMWGAYPLRIYSFGHEDGKIVKEKSLPVYNLLNCKIVADLLEQIAGTEPSQSGLITSLPGTSRHDLNLFFCSTKNITISPEVIQLYKVLLKKRSLWVFFDREKPPWEFGGWEPGVGQTNNMESEGVAGNKLKV